ncbi:hypothetical protein V499_01502 [Pseudogymnoascus sp. VKM F-103]|nr:hypothetical protein V499_01502 [Pseudogymnoascus sp. VKM F-103]
MGMDSKRGSEKEVRKGGPKKESEKEVRKGGPKRRSEKEVRKGGPKRRSEKEVRKGGPKKRSKRQVRKGEGSPETSNRRFDLWKRGGSTPTGSHCREAQERHPPP